MLDFDAYLERLASPAPTPGGGSAAALAGAMSAALVAMVARITRGSAAHAAVHDTADAVAVEADVLRGRFLAARPIDEAAYGAVVAAQALPRATDAERATRTERLQAALTLAAEAPLVVAGLARDALVLCERAGGLRNRHLASDVQCALALARATLDGSAANVGINHRFMTDPHSVASQRGRLSEVTAAAELAEARARLALEAEPSAAQQ